MEKDKPRRTVRDLLEVQQRLGNVVELAEACRQRASCTTKRFGNQEKPEQTRTADFFERL